MDIADGRCYSRLLLRNRRARSYLVRSLRSDQLAADGRAPVAEERIPPRRPQRLLSSSILNVWRSVHHMVHNLAFALTPPDSGRIYEPSLWSL